MFVFECSQCKHASGGQACTGNPIQLSDVHVIPRDEVQHDWVCETSSIYAESGEILLNIKDEYYGMRVTTANYDVISGQYNGYCD